MPKTRWDAQGRWPTDLVHPPPGCLLVLQAPEGTLLGLLEYWAQSRLQGGTYQAAMWSLVSLPVLSCTRFDAGAAISELLGGAGEVMGWSVRKTHGLAQR